MDCSFLSSYKLNILLVLLLEKVREVFVKGVVPLDLALVEGVSQPGADCGAGELLDHGHRDRVLARLLFCFIFVVSFFRGKLVDRLELDIRWLDWLLVHKADHLYLLLLLFGVLEAVDLETSVRPFVLGRKEALTFVDGVAQVSFSIAVSVSLLEVE